MVVVAIVCSSQEGKEDRHRKLVTKKVFDLGRLRRVLLGASDTRGAGGANREAGGGRKARNSSGMCGRDTTLYLRDLIHVKNGRGGRWMHHPLASEAFKRKKEQRRTVVVTGRRKAWLFASERLDIFEMVDGLGKKGSAGTGRQKITADRGKRRPGAGGVRSRGRPKRLVGPAASRRITDDEGLEERSLAGDCSTEINPSKMTRRVEVA